MKKKSKIKKPSTLDKMKRWKKGHPRAFRTLLVLLLILFLLWWVWGRGPMGRALGSLFGNPTTASNNKSPSTFKKLATIDTGDSPNSANPASGGSTSTRTSTGGTTGTSNGGSTSTTTNNSYTNTTNNGGTTTDDDGSSPTAQNKLISAYASIGNGQSESQLIGLGIGQPTNCLVSLALLGEQKICTWTQGSATVIATLINDKVVAKTKVGF